MAEKTIVLGIDGLDYHLLKRWRKELPNFSYLIKKGHLKCLKSTVPPLSVPAWPSIFTGKRERELGAVGFRRFKWGKKDLDLINPKEWAGKEVWGQLGENEISSCLINIPLTYPHKIRGKMLAGLPLSGEGWPKSFEKIVNKKFKINELWKKPKTSFNLNKSKENLKELIKLIKKLLRKDEHDFYFFVLRHIDNCLHGAFNVNDLKKAYKSVDKTLKPFIKSIESKNYDLMVISDHGGREYDKVFYLNTWLIKNGFLDLKNRNPIKKVTLRFADILMGLGLHNFVKKVFLNLKKFNLTPLEKVNWKETEAIAFPFIRSNYGTIFIRNRGKEKVKNKIKKKIPLKSYEPKEVYGDTKNFLPDLIVKSKNLISPKFIPRIKSNKKAFAHTSNGVLITVPQEENLENIRRPWDIFSLIKSKYDL